MEGREIDCHPCVGSGRISRFHEHFYPDECTACRGTGRNWLYPNGSIAAWRGGPFVGGFFCPEPVSVPVALSR